MPGIDLSLAINYLPAVDCLSKTISIVSSLAFVSEQHDLGAFLIIALMLNIDRVFACTRIFDGNAILCTVLGSWIVNFLRVAADAPQFLNPFVTVVWCFGALCLLLEPVKLRPFIRSEADQSSHGGSWSASARVDVSADGARAGRLKRIVPVIMTTVCVGSIAFTRMDREGWAVRFGRSLSFSVLCVVWVYLVGVWRRSGGVLNTFTQNLVGRFCPVLFVNAVCAVLFAGACLVGFGYLYYDMHRPPPGPGSSAAVTAQDYDEVCEEPGEEGPMMTITEEETDEDLEACFRMARQGRVGPGANV